MFRNAGLRETMTYDAAGRQTGRRFNSGERVTQMYDALGRRTTLSDFWGVATTTYDALGRVTRESNRGLAIRYELRTCLAFPFETSALESGTTKRTRQSRAEPQGDAREGMWRCHGRTSIRTVVGALRCALTPNPSPTDDTPW